MKTLTFYSQKLWHSEKPFPVNEPITHAAPAGSSGVSKVMHSLKIDQWLSTAYEVVNPEVVTDRSQRQWLVDGDQITLPDGYGIEKHYQPDSGPLVRRVSIILPEKPDDIDMKDSFIEAFKKTIDAMTDEQLEKELESVGDIGMQGPTITEYYDFLKSQFGVERDDNSAHGRPILFNVEIGNAPSQYDPVYKEGWNNAIDNIEKKLTGMMSGVSNDTYDKTIWLIVEEIQTIRK